jgi:uncharacterized protein (TIGR03663 family)
MIEAWLDRWFVPLGLAIVVVAAALRLPELALNPFHHDEGVNGFFTTRLVRSNVYTYDPANYHGPSLYYFALLSSILFGLTTEALRLVTVVAGIATVGLVLPLRRYLGSLAALTAALLLAISPGAIYVSRYFIHEALLVCFSLGLVVSILLYGRQPRPIWLFAAAAFAALMFTTKETAIITVAVLGIAAVAADRYLDWRRPRRRSLHPAGRLTQRGAATAQPSRSIWVDGVEYKPAGSPSRTLQPAGHGLFAGQTWPAPTQLVGAALIFLVIWVVLYSSFFTNIPKGLVDSLATFAIWTQTGGGTQIQPPLKYLEWMLQADAPILLLGAVGGVLVAVRSRDRVELFIGLWALGITLAYSLIQYKTPWIVLNMLVPLALLAGILIRDLSAGAWRAAAPLLLGAGVVVSGYQAYDLNYVHYDDDRYGYVFVHTTRQALDLVDEIERRSPQAGGTQAGIVFMSPDYWPLPWYFRDYPRAGFFGRIVPTQEAMVVLRVDQEPELDADFKAAYARQGEYNLRPGVDLVLYLRKSTYGL